MKRLPVVAATALLAALALSSCSAESLAERAIETSIENAGGDGADVDFDADTGEFSVETDEGSFSSGGSLPDSFPVDEVPLIDGDLVQAAASEQDGATGYVVLLMVDASADDAIAEAEQQLVDAGFTSDAELAEVPGMTARELVKAPYRVMISAYDAGDEGTGVNYIVQVE